MSKKYFTKEVLKNKNIRKYLASISKYTPVSEEMLDDNLFAMEDADGFRQGVCQLFAYELKKHFGYRVYSIKNEHNVHIFCKSKDGGYYIDVRGVTDDFLEFSQGLYYCYMDGDVEELYEFEQEDFEAPYTDVYQAFARVLIQEEEEYYKIPVS